MEKFDKSVAKVAVKVAISGAAKVAVKLAKRAAGKVSKGFESVSKGG